MIFTKINDQCTIYSKYYPYFCNKITIIDKILRYDTRFLGKELSFYSRQARIKLRGFSTPLPIGFAFLCHDSEEPEQTPLFSRCSIGSL